STAKDFSLFSNKSDSMDYSQESTNRTTFHGRQRCPPHSNQLSCVLYFYEYHSSQQSFSPLLLDPLLSNYVQTVSPIISLLSILPYNMTISNVSLSFYFILRLYIFYIIFY